MSKQYVCHETHAEDLTQQVLQAACDRQPFLLREDEVRQNAGEAMAIAPDMIGRDVSEVDEILRRSTSVTVVATCTAGHQNVFEVDKAECEARGQNAAAIVV